MILTVAWIVAFHVDENKTIIIGKKVEVSLRLFDIFERNRVEHLHRPNEASDEIDRVSKFDNSLSFGAKQNALRQIFFAL